MKKLVSPDSTIEITNCTANFIDNNVRFDRTENGETTGVIQYLPTLWDFSDKSVNGVFSTVLNDKIITLLNQQPEFIGWVIE